MDHDYLRNPSCLLSSTSLDGNIEDVPLPESSTHLSVTTVLNYCKNKILNPYLRLLSITGLRPLINQQEPCVCLLLLNYVYTVHVVVFLITGYFLQYMACFRRDRGFCYKASNTTYLFQNQIQAVYEQICQGSVLFSFVIPSCLHLAGYLHAILIIRSSDDDQLPVLMERVFLSSTNISDGSASRKKLVKTLWTFVGFTGFWMILSLCAVIFMMASGNVTFKWLNESQCLAILLKILLALSTLWHDIVQATVISNYCLQVQLLTTYLQFLREKLLQYPIQPLEWMRHIENFKAMLNYINNKIAPAVCIFTFLNISCALSGILWFFNYDNVDKQTLPIMGISTLNVALWVFIGLVPFIQASRLSNACDILRSVGQEVRTRPFVHQDTPRYELDSILLYTASLKLKAKLFCVPVTGKYLFLFFTLAGVCILVLGQCHYLNMN